MPIVNVNAIYTANDIDRFIEADLRARQQPHEEFKQGDITVPSFHTVTEKIFMKRHASFAMKNQKEGEALLNSQEDDVRQYCIWTQQVQRLPASEIDPAWFTHNVPGRQQAFDHTLWCILQMVETLPKHRRIKPHTIYLASHTGNRNEARFCFKTVEGDVVEGLVDIKQGLTNPALRKAIVTKNKKFQCSVQDMDEVKDLVQYEEHIYPSLRQQIIHPVATQIKQMIEAWIDPAKAMQACALNSSSMVEQLVSSQPQTHALKILWPVRIHQVWYVVEWVVASKLADCRLWVYSPYEESGFLHQDLYIILKGLQHQLSLFSPDNRRLLEFYTHYTYAPLSTLQKSVTVNDAFQQLWSEQEVRRKDLSPLQSNAETHYGHSVWLNDADVASSGAVAVKIVGARCQGMMLEHRKMPLLRGAIHLRQQQIKQCETVGLPVAAHLRQLPRPETLVGAELLATFAGSEMDLAMESKAWDVDNFQVYQPDSTQPIYAFKGLDDYSPQRLVLTAASLGDSQMLAASTHFGSILTPYHVELLEYEKVCKIHQVDPHWQTSRYKVQLDVIKRLDEVLTTFDAAQVKQASSVLLNVIKKGQLLGSLCQYLFEEDEQALLAAKVLPKETLTKLKTYLRVLSRYLTSLEQLEDKRLKSVAKQSDKTNFWNASRIRQAMCGHLYQLNLLDAKPDGVQRQGARTITLFKQEQDCYALVTNHQNTSWVVSFTELDAETTYPVDILPWHEFNNVLNAQDGEIEVFKRWFLARCPDTESGDAYTVNLMRTLPELPEPFTVTVLRENNMYQAIVRNGLLVSHHFTHFQLNHRPVVSVNSLDWCDEQNNWDVSGEHAKQFTQWLASICPHTDPMNELHQIKEFLELFLPILRANLTPSESHHWELEQPWALLQTNPFERMGGAVNTKAQLRLLPELLKVLHEVTQRLLDPAAQQVVHPIPEAELDAHSQKQLQETLEFALLYQMRLIVKEQTQFQADRRYYTVRKDGGFIESNDEMLADLQKTNAEQLKRDMREVIQLLEDFFQNGSRMSIEGLRSGLNQARKRCEVALSKLNRPDEKESYRKRLELLDGMQNVLEVERCNRLAQLIDSGRLRVSGLSTHTIKEQLTKREARRYAFSLLQSKPPYAHTVIEHENQNTLLHALCYLGRCWDFIAQLIETPLQGVFERHFSQGQGYGWNDFETIRRQCIQTDYLAKYGVNRVGLFPKDIGSVYVSLRQQEYPQWLLDGLQRTNQWSAVTTLLPIVSVRSMFYRVVFEESYPKQQQASAQWVFAVSCDSSNQRNLFHYLVAKIIQGSKDKMEPVEMFEQELLTRLLSQYARYRSDWARQEKIHTAYLTDQHRDDCTESQVSRLLCDDDEVGAFVYRPEDRIYSHHIHNPLIISDKKGASAFSLLEGWRTPTPYLATLKCRLLNEILLTLLHDYPVSTHPVSPFMAEVRTVLLTFQRDRIPEFYEQSRRTIWNTLLRTLASGFRHVFSRNARSDLTPDMAWMLGKMCQGLVRSSESDNDRPLQVALVDILEQKADLELRVHPWFQALFVRLEQISQKYLKALRTLEGQQYTYRFDVESTRSPVEEHDRWNGEQQLERVEVMAKEARLLNIVKDEKIAQLEAQLAAYQKDPSLSLSQTRDERLTMDEKSEIRENASVGVAQAGLFGGGRRHDGTQAQAIRFVEKPAEQSSSCLLM